MAQLNIHLTPNFERDLSRLMKVRRIKTKTEAIRVAVHESLEKALFIPSTVDFSNWLGLGIHASINKHPRFPRDDDLWK